MSLLFGYRGKSIDIFSIKLILGQIVLTGPVNRIWPKINLIENISILFPRWPKSIDILLTARQDMVGGRPVKSDNYTTTRDEFIDEKL